MYSMGCSAWVWLYRFDCKCGSEYVARLLNPDINWELVVEEWGVDLALNVDLNV